MCYRENLLKTKSYKMCSYGDPVVTHYSIDLKSFRWIYTQHTLDKVFGFLTHVRPLRGREVVLS